MTLISLALSVALASLASQEDLPVSQEESQAAYEEFLATLDFQTGHVSIAGKSVTFDLPEGWALLQSHDARTVVEDIWGNPEDPSTLAFIDPPSSEGRLGSNYGIIVSIDDSGYVDDEDASGLDYGDMLKEMQADARGSNKERAQMGYETVEIVGWAEPPHYDSAEKKLYWAKELRFGGAAATTLNYDVRILGRRGYLQLQAVAPTTALREVDAGIKALLPVTHFTAGHKYGEFNSSTDKIAAYGIGGLIAGKLAAKVGLFAVIAKFGKLIAVGAIGLFLMAKKFLFGESRSSRSATAMAGDGSADGADGGA